MNKFLARGLLLISFVFSMGMNAQEHIPLSNDEITRFGIEFTPVQLMDGSAGMRVPATVTNSPLSTSGMIARYTGVLDSWQVMPGERVAADQVIGIIKSQEVLGIQQDWIIADSSLKEAEFNLGKDQKLLEQGVISQQRLVATQRDFQQARINAQAARQKLQQAGFNQMQLQALLDNGEGLGFYFIRTPVDGSISHLAVNAGDYISDNTELVSFSSGNLWVRAQAPARLGQQLEMGQQLRMADSNHTLTLRLQDFVANENSQMIELYAEFDNQVSRLPGQVVSLMLTPKDGGILLPGNAVVHSGELTQVFVRQNGGVEIRTLSLIPLGTGYLAQSGINAGEQVVTQGAAQLKGILLGLGGE